jgi:TolB-like protein
MDARHVVFGAFRLDPLQRVLWRNDVPVELGSRAADILCMLVAAGGAVVSKDNLIAEVWPGQIVEENTLQAQVSGLRKALGEAGQSFVVTVAGRGYRFVSEEPAEGVEPRRGPSIAVLAFDNLSGDPADECFADGMAEDIITELSRSRTLLVVARNSSFALKGRRIDMRQVGQELGVRYLLEGSIRRLGSRLRVNAQLIEAQSGLHVWAERYDRALTDLFATQDEITLAVSRAIEPAVESAEKDRVQRKRPDSLDAWEAWQRAQHYVDTEQWGQVESWLRRSIALDPRFAAPHAELGFWLWSTAAAGRVPFPQTRDEAEAETRLAIGLDPYDPMGHAILSICRLGLRDPAGAIRSARRAEELGPSVWHAHCAGALAHAGAQQPAEAQRHVALLHQITPRGAGRRITLLLDAYLRFLHGEYDLAVAGAEMLVEDHPHYPHPYWLLAASLGLLDHRRQSAMILARWLATAPGQSTQFAELGGIPWLSLEASNRVLEGLRIAGWVG